MDTTIDDRNPAGFYLQNGSIVCIYILDDAGFTSSTAESCVPQLPFSMLPPSPATRLPLDYVYVWLARANQG